MNIHPAVTIILLGVCLLIGGCGKAPGPVLDLKVSDGDWTAYQRSLEAIAARQTPEERKEFEQALQEMKFQAMLDDGRTSSGPEINGRVRAQIAGLTVRDVLVLNLTIKLGRKQEQEEALVRSLTKNSRLRTRDGDVASASFLQSVKDDLAKKLETLRSEIAVLEQRINELQPGHIISREPGAPTDEPVPLKDLDERPEMKKPAPTDRRKLA